MNDGNMMKAGTGSHARKKDELSLLAGHKSIAREIQTLLEHQLFSDNFCLCTVFF